MIEGIHKTLFVRKYLGTGYQVASCINGNLAGSKLYHSIARDGHLVIQFKNGFTRCLQLDELSNDTENEWLVLNLPNELEYTNDVWSAYDQKKTQCN